MKSIFCRRIAYAALCVPLTFSSSITVPIAAAQEEEISPAGCQALGIQLPSGSRFAGGGAGGLAPPTNAITTTARPSPPPPPAPPAPSSSLNTVTVQANRIQLQGFQAPTPVGSNPQDTQAYPHADQNPVKQVVQEPVSTFSVDVDTASYSNVRRFLHDGHLPPTDAVRVEEMINYFNYGYPLPAKASEPFTMTTAMVPSPWSARRRILQIGLQGYDIPRTAQPPMNLVFLMDTSGSMTPPDRLPLAKKALNVLIRQLRPQDHVSLVAYAGSAGAVLGPTSGDQKLKINCAIEALSSGGSTAGGAGLTLAYAMGEQNFQKNAVNRIILMTDGDFNVGISDRSRLKDFITDKRKTGIYLSVYGFGRDNYHDTTMQTLAQEGNGTAAYIDSLDEARKLFQDDLSGSIFPIADDVKVQVEFNPTIVSEYRLIGYETRLLKREDFNNDQVDAGEVGSRASVTALYELTLVGDPPSSDPLRYQAEFRPAPGGAGELAFLKVRYKLPGQDKSILIQKPIPTRNTAPTVAAAPEATRWALAVAAFGEKLRGSPWIDKTFDWDKIHSLAQDARGTDPYGLRAEFVRLVDSAKDASKGN